MNDLKQKIQAAVNLYKSGNFVKCQEITKKLMVLNPNVVFLYNLMGLVLTALNKNDEAIDVYNKGIEIDPNYAMIYNNLGTIYYKNNSPIKSFETNIKKAEEFYKKAIKLNSNIPEANSNLGNLYNSLGKNEQSIKYHKLAILADPKYLFSYLNIANVYLAIGDFNEAEKYLKELIKLNPDFTQAHRLLSRITKYTKKNTHLLQLEDLFKKLESADDVNKMNIAFALGKANEDVGEIDKSFEYYKTANKINRSKINFSIEKEKKYFDEIKNTYDNKLFEKYKEFSVTNSSSIFIVGMPRSGTTLIEQILSSHKDVYGADEVTYLPNLIDEYFGQNKINLSLQNFFDFEKDNLRKIANDYISSMKLISQNSKKTTDKLPENFLNIGFIKLILPKSKIIHCCRDPKDNIFSIFKNYFTGNKITYSSDLNEIVQYYNLYFDLMNFWNKLIPNFILNLKYEDLIKDTEKEVRRLLNFCELPWENDCLEFYKNKRPVKTASDTQIRNKIYDTSVNKWKKYESFLEKYYDKLKI
tara:strand:- start:3020 stop:4603 length:1584 start_codon:yes stop_codon:yes gene_type:complete